MSNNEAGLLTPFEVQTLGADTFHRKIVGFQLVVCCWNCENVDRNTDGCSLANGERPPLEIVTFGCPAWAPDIPF